MDGRWSMGSEAEIWRRDHFGCFLCLIFSSLDIGPVQMASAWVFTTATGGGVSPCAGSAERSPLSCADPLWDLWVRTIAYVG